MSYIIVKPDELYHYGILGQKWGVRRFQNPDGSLTEAGKARYISSNDGKSYKLTDEGIKQEKKAYDKLYGKGSYDKRESTFKKLDNDLKNDMYWNQSSDLLKILTVTSVKQAIDYSNQHMNLVNSGKLFTDEYFRTKISRLASINTGIVAKDILAERSRLFEEAKKNDTYSLDYLEMTPDNFSERSKKERLADYNNWLNDPKKWREERYKH